MKVFLSKHHSLTTICGVSYLLPYGQGIVDYQRQLKLNETAAALWRIITELIPESGMERDILVTGLCDAYNSWQIQKQEPESDCADGSDYSPEDLKSVLMPIEDACGFIDSLVDAGALKYE